MDYSKQVIEDMEYDTNIKNISPMFYIFETIKKLQDCLILESITTGMSKYCFLVKHLEQLCVSSKIVPENWDSSLKNKDSENSKKTHEERTISNFKRAEEKLGLLLKYIFDPKTITSPLKA